MEEVNVMLRANFLPLLCLLINNHYMRIAVGEEQQQRKVNNIRKSLDFSVSE
jgi:hypothetical protein